MTSTAEQPTTVAVEVADLVKTYPKADTNAVDGVSFTVRRGEIFGLLGPNGAGKTTTIGVLTTMVRATSGLATVDGIDVGRDPVGARRAISVVPQRSNLDQQLTARQNLVLHAAYHGIPVRERAQRADALLEEFGLGERGGDKTVNYSGGMAQRLMIARALMHAPSVLFLDEPSTGLDPQARLFVWDRVRDLQAAGVTVIITTHDMEEAAELSDRVGIMDHGRLLALDTPQNLTRSLPGSSTLDVTFSMPGTVPGTIPGTMSGEPSDGAAELVREIRNADGVESAEPVTSPMDDETRVRLFLSGKPTTVIGPIAQLVTSRGGELGAITPGEPSLEDVFINLTGRDLR
ncbi:MAG TPA: ATP-binding cassette domain-containing protein [Jiangellaceae bacterium]|nr:ATP-binding cassette domain-containing protein [Jiangellaceae bacterium]